MLAELENIDDEADANGIDFVKIDDSQLAKDVGVYALPAIVFYRTGSEDPIIYAGTCTLTQMPLVSGSAVLGCLSSFSLLYKVKM